MKGSLATSLLVLCVCVLPAARVRAQRTPECPVITAEELGSTAAPSREGLIAAFLRTGESGLPLVQLFDFNIVCFNSGTSRNRYKRLSLVANYSCSDGPCPFGAEEGIFQTQFDIECSSTPTDPFVWIPTVLGNPDQSPPDANLSTPSRSDCGLCINPRSSIAPDGVDPITHCLACDVSCTGAGICASILPEDCCNFFNLDDVCVIECPDGQLPNDDNECSVVVGFTEPIFQFSEADGIGEVTVITNSTTVDVPGGPAQLEITGESVDLGGVDPSGIAFNDTRLLDDFAIVVQFMIQQDNTALEEDEFYSISIRSLHPRVIAGGGGFFGTTIAFIVDEDVVIVGFSGQANTVNEGSSAVTLSRSTVVARAFTIQVQGGPVPLTDVTFGAGPVFPSVSFPFNVNDDIALEDPEVFFLEITDPSNNPQIQIGGSMLAFDFIVFNQTEVTVLDDDVVIVGFSGQANTVNEGSSAVTLSRSTVVARAFTIQVQGGPVPLTDVTFGAGPVFPSVSFPFDVDDDIALEDPEMFFLEITDPSNDPQIQIGGSILAFDFIVFNQTEVTVLDDDVVIVGFSGQANTVNEGSSAVTLSRSTVVARAFTIQVQGGPVPLTDVTFGAGPVFPSVNFPFDVDDDIALEDPEVFFLEITDPSNDPQIQIGGSILAFDFIVFNQTEVTVLDDDVVIVGFSGQANTVNEGSSAVTLSRSTVVARAFTIQVQGGPVPLTDVTFGAGPVFPSVSFPFDVDDDIALEDPEVFFLEITDPSNDPQIQIGGSILAFDFIVFNQTEVTVLDDDVVIVGFSGQANTVNEGSSAVTLSRSTVVARAFTIQVQGGPVPLTDVTFGAGPVFPSVSFPFNVNDDIALEDPEVFFLEITDPSNNPQIQIGGSMLAFDFIVFNQTEVTVLDDDVVIVGFSGQANTVNEGSSAVTLSRSTVVARAFTIQVQGGPVPLTDVTFGAGPVFPSVSFPFDVDDDIALEDPEVFFLEITDPSNDPQIQIGGSILAFDFIVFNQTEVTVLDDDVVIVGFQAPNSTFLEEVITATVVLIRSSVAARPYTVQVQGGPVPPTSVFFGAGTVSPFVDFSFDIEDDIALEDPEVFFLEIIDPSNDPQIQIGGSLDEFGVTFYNRTEITVIDTDVVLVGFELDNVTFSEDDGTVSLTVTRLMTVAQPFTLEVTSSPSSGGMFAPSAPDIFTTVTFGAGPVAPSVQLTFEIEDDLIALESPEIFTILLNTSDTKRIRVGGIRTVIVGTTIEVFAVFRAVSVTIEDNEVATYGFEPTEYRVAEGSAVEVRVVGTHVTAQTLLFTMDTIAGTADANDFQQGPFGVLCLQNTSECQPVQIDTFSDLEVEGNETFDLRLTLEIPGLIVSPAAAVVTIDDATVFDCGTLPPPANGEIALSGTTLGSTATYTCNTGFTLEGSDTRVCLESGWNGTEPRCAALCPDPVDIVNGMVTFTGNSVGDTASYTCNSDFELIGGATTTCTLVDVNTAVFTPDPPVCRPLCPDPVDIVNGMVTFTGNSVGDTASYTCNSDFELIGGATTTCTLVDVNTVFTPDPPVCRPLCPDPVDIANGMVTFTGNSVGDTATYTCDPGFELIRGATTTCTQVNANSAEFSPPPPACRPLCPNPVDIANGMVTFTGNSVGDTATYTCDPGFELIRGTTTTCTQVDANSAEFSPPPPACRPLCPNPVDIANGMVTFIGNSVGDTATYTCDPNFELIGVTTTTCTEVDVNTAEFSPNPPVCRPLQCPDPVDIANGMVTFTGNSVGNTATYTCDPDFDLIGGATTTCTQVDVNTAVFLPAPPLCRLPGDVVECSISSPSTIQTFRSQATYNFNQTCEHFLVTSCLPPGGALTNFSIRLDLLDGQISTGRIGIRYNNVRAVIFESGTIDTSGDPSQYDLVQTPTGGTFTLLEIPVSVVYTLQSGALADVAVRVQGTLPGTCGLCGNATGHPVLRDQTLVDLTDSDQARQFFYEYFVRPGETILRRIERPECGLLRNDTIIGDPLYTVPLFDDQERHLCYEIHGQAGQYFNLISDECLSVNSLYAERNVTIDLLPERLNVLDEIGIRAVDRSGSCVNIRVRLDGCSASVNDQPTIRYNRFGITVRRSDGQVRVSVPNCEDTNVVMRVFCDSVDGVSMIRFVVTRGLNLRETAHGFIGQFWNIPISVERFNGPIRDGSTNVYIVTVTTPSGDQRSFPAWLEPRTWDGRRTPCFYAGTNQGGRVSEVNNPNDPVIEGNYRQYRVNGNFDTEFMYSHFDNSRCEVDG